jgi:hypothetical protein
LRTMLARVTNNNLQASKARAMVACALADLA